MKLQPTLDRIAIKPDPRETETKGGIIIPDKAQKRKSYGTVMAVGPGTFNLDGSRRKMPFKKGDWVLYTGCHDLTPTGSEIEIVDEEDILAVVSE